MNPNIDWGQPYDSPESLLLVFPLAVNVLVGAGLLRVARFAAGRWSKERHRATLQRLTDGLWLVFWSTVLSGVYGIVHDLVTSRVCFDYFRKLHPPLIEASINDVYATAILWGVVATWWVGALGGVLLAWAALAGARPPSDVLAVRRRVGSLLLLTALAALLTGCVCAALAALAVLRVPVRM